MKEPQRVEAGSVINLFDPLPDASTAEAVDLLLNRPGVRIERIVSLGQASPPDFWYDQDEHEWVLLLAGAACLRFEDEPEARQLAPGNCVDIEPHRRHRVDWTDPSTPTIWLTVFIRANSTAPDSHDPLMLSRKR